MIVDNCVISHFRYDLLTRCWSELPENRPSFEDIVHEIDMLLTGMSEYLQLSEFPG